MDSSANNKRIVKNTLLLYFRMLLLMLISLYTSRVILNALGVEDYGIYNVVGGVVAMFSLLSGSIRSAISRFITFELGTGNAERLKKVFSCSVTIQIGLALIIILIAETVGLWFLNYKMVIPDGRMQAANWCFQISIITFAVHLISAPFNATIIAHEKMSAFAYISILEATGKLLVAWSIAFSPIDRLVFYASMLALIACFICFLYAWYCKRHFEECTYRFIYDHSLLKQMFSFAGWNFMGTGSYLLMTQGVNILMNVYFGVVVNAARGIATQVDHAVMAFVENFTTALNPQITKSYASDQREYMFTLMFKGAKLSYFLLLLFAVPLLCETDVILHLWLKTVPDYAVAFVRLTLIISMIHSVSLTMITAMYATGKIKKYQIIVGGAGMLVFPLAWLLFVIGLSPESAYICNIAVYILQLCLRIYLLHDMVGMSVYRYMHEVLLKVTMTSLIAFSFPLIVCYVLEDSYTRFSLVLLVGAIFTVSSIYFVGLNNDERQFVVSQIRKRFIKV
jgi:O-antigen/teichoic acid export membrane protein